MNYSKIIIAMLLPLLLISCHKNDDDPSGPIVDEVLPPQAIAYIPKEANTVIMDLSDGSIQNILSGSFQTLLAVDNSVYYISENSLIKASTIGGSVEWEYEFLQLLAYDNKFNNSEIVLIDGYLYITFERLNTTTYETIHYIQQISIDGVRGWTNSQSDFFNKLLAFNGYLITYETIAATHVYVVRKRDPNTGDILSEYSNGERIVKMYPAGNNLIVVSEGNKIVSLDNSLSENWLYPTGLYNGIYGLVDQGAFINYSYIGKVEAIDIASGNLIWVKEFPMGRAKGLYKINNKLLAITANDSSLDVNILDPSGGDVENTTTFSLGPNNQFDAFGVSLFDHYILFVQRFNTVTSPDPLFTMASLDGDIFWTRTLADPFDNKWFIQTATESYYNDYAF